MTTYDNVKGYAYDETIKIEQLENKIEKALNIVLSYGNKRIENILIAGCGKGNEAYPFFKYTKANVYGIDLNVFPIFKSVNNRIFQLKMDSIDKLSFSDEKFDLIYCYHVLEHVNAPLKVLLELKRVLSKNGIIFIGFPNRRRMLPGYIFSHLNISLLEIIKFNLNDYKMRLCGKFKNEFGAHAGFTEKEFLAMTKPIFNETISIRGEWIKSNYPKFLKFFKFIDKIMLADFFYPSNYYIIRK